MCHNAHGSVVKAHLLYSKETACKICHNLGAAFMLNASFCEFYYILLCFFR